jgi:hypothetical protein
MDAVSGKQGGRETRGQWYGHGCRVSSIDGNANRFDSCSYLSPWQFRNLCGSPGDGWKRKAERRENIGTRHLWFSGFRSGFRRPAADSAGLS